MLTWPLHSLVRNSNQGNGRTYYKTELVSESLWWFYRSGILSQEKSLNVDLPPNHKLERHQHSSMFLYHQTESTDTWITPPSRTIQEQINLLRRIRSFLVHVSHRLHVWRTETSLYGVKRLLVSVPFFPFSLLDYHPTEDRNLEDLNRINSCPQGESHPFNKCSLGLTKFSHYEDER